MPYTAHPVWSFPPNWDRGILEGLEWATDVLASENGTEQRISKRLTPRRSFEASFFIRTGDLQYFQNYMSRNQSADTVIPVWHQVTRTTAASAIGTDLIYLDTAYREYRVGGLVYLRGKDSRKWEVATILAITSTTLQLVANLEKAWPKGTYVYPALIGEMEDAISTKKITDTAIEVTTRFYVTAANPYPPARYFFRKYFQVPVLELKPDESEDLTASYRRNMSVFDSGRGKARRLDLYQRAMNSVSYRWAFIGRIKHHRLREFLYYLRGRAKAVWVPSFMNDFTPMVQPTSSFSTITVENVGFTSLDIASTERVNIRIVLSNGAIGYRKITSSVELGDTEVLTLDSPFYTPDNVTITQISYIDLYRLDQDSVELNHITDTEGVTTTSVIWTNTANATPIHDPTSRPYSIVYSEGVQMGFSFKSGNYLEIPPEPFSVGMSMVGGTLTLTYFPVTYNHPTEDRFGVGMSMVSGTLATTYFPVTYNHPTEDSFGVGFGMVSGVLAVGRQDYSLWPPEGMQMGFNFVSGTLT